MQSSLLKSEVLIYNLTEEKDNELYRRRKGSILSLSRFLAHVGSLVHSDLSLLVEMRFFYIHLFGGKFQLLRTCQP